VGDPRLVVGGVAGACVILALLFTRLSARCLRGRRYGASAMHGMASLVALLVAVAVALIGLDLLTYDRLTHEQPAAEIAFNATGEQRFDAVLDYPTGTSQRVALRGDEWQIDARIIKWTAFANMLGFDAAYRLERISGRYADVERDRTAVRTVQALNPPERFDTWRALRLWHRYVPGVDALYGTAVYLPMSDGARYQVFVSQSGLLARPLNDDARQAVGEWKPL